MRRFIRPLLSSLSISSKADSYRSTRLVLVDFSDSVRRLVYETGRMSKRKDPTQGNPNKEFCDFLMGKVITLIYL